MIKMPVQRALIAYLRINTPIEYADRRAFLRREGAILLAPISDDDARRHCGQLYRNRKAAMVIAAARTVSIRQRGNV
jgi:hypothetical protein